MQNRNKISCDNQLLKKFNNRDSVAFGEIYTLFHKELTIYTNTLYRGTEIIPDDVLNDIFVTIWTSKTTFESLQHIKSYVYLSIKNNFRNYLVHNNYKIDYLNRLRDEDKYDVNIVESELYSVVDEAIKLLPETYALVLKMYINGWKTGEIAGVLDRTEQNIYNIKYEAINILRKKLTKNNLFLIIFMLG